MTMNAPEEKTLLLVEDDRPLRTERRRTVPSTSVGTASPRDHQKIASAA
jgi:hypothetical protein